MLNNTSIEMITTLVGSNVKVNLGGPESKTGRLLAVQSDFLVIATKQGEVIYYQLMHVKGVSINPKDGHRRSSGSVRFINEECFNDVLKRLVHKRVKINRGGPESVEGVLNNAHATFLEVTGKDDVFFLSIEHIKSISHVSRKSSGSGNKNSSGNKKSSGNKNSSGNKRTSGNRKSSNNRNTSGKRQTSKRRQTSRRRSSSDEVLRAITMAAHTGTDRFMHNNPESGSRSTGKNRRTSCRSNRTGSANQSRSSRKNRTSGRSRSSRCSCRSRSSRRSDQSRCSRSSRRSRHSRSSRKSGHHKSSRGPKRSRKRRVANAMKPRPLGRYFRV